MVPAGRLQAASFTMDPATHALIVALHQTPCRMVLALTGGGASAAADLLAVPGGSKTILEVIIPYGEQALADFLGQVPEQFCSLETSRILARRALERARWLAPGEDVVGLGSTASLASDRPKRGDHRVHLSIHRGEQCRSFSLTLNKGARDRQGEETLLKTLILNALAEAVGLEDRLELALLPGEATRKEQLGDTTLACFLRGELATLRMTLANRIQPGNWDPAHPMALMPGSFNPVHAGHWALAVAAAKRLDLPVAFELSIANVDKPALAVEELRQRLPQFQWHAPVWLTRAPTFVEKARLFPRATFVVGADTAVRIVAPRYYEGAEEGMLRGLSFLRDQGCQFLVAGRVDSSGQFIGLESIAIPNGFQQMFQALPSEAFRLDLSSTAIRSQN